MSPERPLAFLFKEEKPVRRRGRRDRLAEGKQMTASLAAGLPAHGRHHGEQQHHVDPHHKPQPSRSIVHLG